MRFLTGLVFIALSFSSIVRSEPEAVASSEALEANHDKAFSDPKLFCRGRPEGRYAWSKAMEIVCCPGGKIEHLKEGRFAPLLGRVPHHYKGELAFNVHQFCEGKSGYYCPPEGTDSLGMWKCPEGQQVACPWGQVCQRHGKHDMCVNPHQPPLKDCKTVTVHEKKDKKVVEITCKGDPCLTAITYKPEERPKTNVICTKTQKCCTEETVSTTKTDSCSRRTKTVTTEESCRPTMTSSTETCSWVKPTDCSCESECSCSRTRSCQTTPTCSCSNHKTITKTATIWKNETCHVVDPKCTTTKTLTEEYVCLSYATHCLYNPRFEELESQNIDWEVRPKCETASFCEKWGWRGCEHDRDGPVFPPLVFEVKSAVQAGLSAQDELLQEVEENQIDPFPHKKGVLEKDL